MHKVDKLGQMHEHLKDSYRDESGEYANSCTLIAINFAQKIIENGGSPQILVIRGQKADELNRRQLVPTPYMGAVKWSAHVICTENNIVYDPMLPEALPLNDYLHAAFKDQAVELEDYSIILNQTLPAVTT